MPDGASARHLRRARRLAAVLAAPFTQSLSSLVLQVVALRELGAEGFATYALLYSGLVLATGLSSGLVGDSLTVLDRRDPALRAGLVRVGWRSTLLVSALGVVATAATGLLPLPSAALFGAAVAAFLLETLVRRLLMAELRYWRIVVTDLVVAAVASSALVASAATAAEGMGLDHVVASLLVGQLAGILAGVALLPPAERRLARAGDADVASVLRFGVWRAAQQGIRPASLTAVRIVAVAAAGSALFGQLEAARTYTAPAMLVVNGAAGFFFASYARQRDRTTAQLLGRADAGVRALALGMAVMCAVALLLQPLAEDHLTDGRFELDRVAVAGWIVYAGASAVGMPYGSLASVRGKHALMVKLRAAEALGVLALVAIALFAFDVGVSWVPLVLSVGPLVTAILTRRTLPPSTALEEDTACEPVLTAPPS